MKRLITAFVLCTCALCLTACGGPKEVEAMAYTVSIGETQYTGEFSGTTEKKIPNGVGTFVSADGLTYSGDWENGLPVSVCSMELDGYTVEIAGNSYTGLYKGEAVDALPNGSGEFVFSDEKTSATYIGGWESGTPNGEGTLDYSGEDGYIRYSGGWKNGGFSGIGQLESDCYVVHFTDGLDRTGYFSGDVIDGIASGTGIFTAINSDGNEYTYEGEWKKGLWEGEGARRFKDSPWVYNGRYEEGEFTPTPAQFFATMGSGYAFDISEKSINFINEHACAFTENIVDDESIEFEENFKYEAFSKNSSQYGDKLIEINNLKVVQIFEYEDWGYEYTFFIAQDSQYRVYYCYKLGYADEIYEGSRVKMVALPVDYMTYENTMGNTIYAIACAVVSITK